MAWLLQSPVNKNHYKRRSTMKKLTLTIFTVLLVMAMAALSFGYGWGRGEEGRGWGPGPGPCAGDCVSALSGLNLTADQEAKIRSLREEQVKEIKPLRDAMFSKRDDLRLLWREKNPDQEKIVSVQREIRGLRDQVQDKATAGRLAMLKVLTPEQQDKFQSYGGKGFGPGAGRGSGQCAGRGAGWGRGPGCGPR